MLSLFLSFFFLISYFRSVLLVLHPLRLLFSHERAERYLRFHASLAENRRSLLIMETTLNYRYPGALLVAVACLAVRARGVRDNNREAAFIGLAVGLSLPIWISSGIGSIAAGNEGDREAWLAYGLLATSLFVFLTMFLPKGRQLAALGREGPTAVIRDRDDALSSLPGSGYSPSFFHFKPAETSLKRKMHYHSAGGL